MNDKIRQAKIILEGYFGKVFDFKNPKPLKIGIIKDMINLAKKNNFPFSGVQIRIAINYYTSRTKYIVSILKNEYRYDLNQNISGEVTFEQKNVAKKLLLERTKNKIK